MLVLERKRDESIVICREITVTVLGIDGDRVKLGVQAPRELSVIRRELCDDEVRRQNLAAAESSSLIHKLPPELKGNLARK